MALGPVCTGQGGKHSHNRHLVGWDGTSKVFSLDQGGPKCPKENVVKRLKVPLIEQNKFLS